MTPTTPPTGTGAGKASPGRRALPCMAPIGNGQLCVLKRQHAGTHLPFARWCAADITETNPSVRSSK